MKDSQGIYYYPNPADKRVRMYVRESFGQVEFRQAFHDLVEPARLLVQFLGEGQGVQRLHAVDVGDDLADLVGLQMADELPADICRQINLVQQLLGMVFPEHAFAKVIIGHDFGLGSLFCHHAELRLAGDHAADGLIMGHLFTLLVSNYSIKSCYN